MTAAAIIAGVGFYASSLSRSLLQALPAVFCIVVLCGLAVDLAVKAYLAVGGDMGFGALALFYALAWPTLIITMIWLAFRNYKRLHIGWRVWFGDLIRSGVVFGCITIATTAIFDRSWELFLPLEPRHGPAQITGTGRPDIAVTQSNVFVVLPDTGSGLEKKIPPTQLFRDVLRLVPIGWILRPIMRKRLPSNQTAPFGNCATKQTCARLAPIRTGKRLRREAAFFLRSNKMARSGVGDRSITDCLWRVQLARAKNTLPLLFVSAKIPIGCDVHVPNDSQAIGIKRDGSTWMRGDVRNLHG